MKIIHIVRRYGPVGGMERYVWETTNELAKRGHQVQVLCEYSTAPATNGIEVHELGRMFFRPRWLYYWRFSLRVNNWLHQHPQPGWLIHSHERVAVHHATTFHGPPFASVRDKPWWKKISIRIAMQLYMERRELRIAQRIVPNSEIISRQLAHYYPDYAAKLTKPVAPGVLPGVVRAARNIPCKGGIIGFVGREWQRKGLPFAVEIFSVLRRNRPDLQFFVTGPTPAEVQHLFAGLSGGYKLTGWSEQAHYDAFDVLLHPAIAEPYGMVISEAMAARVPVVVSDLCGAAADVSNDAGSVLSLASSAEVWAQAVEAQLARQRPVPQFDRSWVRVAQEYENIYQEIQGFELK